MSRDLFEDPAGAQGPEGQVGSKLRVEANPLPPIRSRESNQGDRVAPTNPPPEPSGRLVGEAGFGAIRAAVPRLSAAEVSAVARSAAGIGDSGSPVTVRHGGETLSGRRVVGRDGQESVVTGVGKFERDRNSGQWVPRSSVDNGGNKPSQQAGSDSTSEQTVAAPEGRNDQLRSDQSPTQEPSRSNITDSGEGLQKPKQNGKSAEANASENQSGQRPTPANLLSFSSKALQRVEAVRNEMQTVKPPESNLGNNQNGTSLSLGTLMAQPVPVEPRAESELKSKAKTAGTNLSDNQSVNATLGDLISQGTAAPQSPVGEPKKEETGSGSLPQAEVNVAARPLVESTSPPHNGPGDLGSREKEKKQSGAMLSGDNTIGANALQSIIQAPKPEVEVLDRKKPVSTAPSEVRADPPLVQSLSNAIRNLEPLKKPEPDVQGGSVQEPPPTSTTRVPAQQNLAELAEEKIRNSNPVNGGQGGLSALVPANPHFAEYREKEKEQFYSPSQSQAVSGRTPEQLSTISALANQVPAGGGSGPRPEEYKPTEARRVAENLNNLPEVGLSLSAQQQLNHIPRSDGASPSPEYMENRFTQRLAESIENPPTPQLDSRQPLHLVEIYSAPPLRSDRPADSQPAGRPLELAGPVSLSERPLSSPDQRMPEAPVISRIQERQLPSRPAPESAPAARSFDPAAPQRSNSDQPPTQRAVPEQVRPVDAVRPAELALPPIARPSEQLFALINRSDRLADQPPPPPLSSDRKPDLSNQIQDKRAELIAPPPLSITDKRLEPAGLRELSVTGSRLRDFIKDESMPDFQRSIKDSGKESLTLRFAGQKIELLKGLEQNLTLPGLKIDAIKEGLSVTGAARADGIVRGADSSISGRLEVGKGSDATVVTGVQRIETGKITEGQSSVKAEITGEGKRVATNATGNGIKQADGLLGLQDNHSNIAGQKEIDSNPGRRPEATGKVDNDFDVETESDEPPAGKKKDDQSMSIIDVPVITGFAISPESALTGETKSNKDEEESRKEPDRRQKYIVKKGDTLESIAEKQLRDRKLAQLLYEINKKIIPSKDQGGKMIIALRPKLIIYLPTAKESKEFRAMPYNGTFASFAYATEACSPEQELQNKLGNWYVQDRPSAVAKQPDCQEIGQLADTRSIADASESPTDLSQICCANKESLDDGKEESDQPDSFLLNLANAVETEAQDKTCLERDCYVVRLGDTLKSVAMSHRSLRDVSLWRLLAQLNKLSTAIDAQGVPAARLARGQRLELPTIEEIKDFKHKLSVQPVIPIAVARTQSETTTQNSLLSTNEKTRHDSAEADRNLQIPRLSDSSLNESVVLGLANHCRFVRAMLEAECIDYRLEVEYANRWFPIVCYQILDGKAIRHEFRPDGSRKTLNIDLPLSSVRELAENDIANNWNQYCSMYLQRIGA